MVYDLETIDSFFFRFSGTEKVCSNRERDMLLLRSSANILLIVASAKLAAILVSSYVLAVPPRFATGKEMPRFADQDFAPPSDLWRLATMSSNQIDEMINDNITT